MTTPLLIRRLTLQNFLSYGSEGVSVDLLPLNVLIGPNGSGKSNLLEALSILRATAKDLQGAIREGGGIDEYIWKGAGDREAAILDAILDDYDPFFTDRIQYRIELARNSTRLDVAGELIKGVATLPRKGIEIAPTFQYRNGTGIIRSTRRRGASHTHLRRP
jgi:predicted ATPase